MRDEAAAIGRWPSNRVGTAHDLVASPHQPLRRDRQRRYRYRIAGGSRQKMGVWSDMHPMLSYPFGEGCYLGGREAPILVHLADPVVEKVPGELAANHDFLSSAFQLSSE